MPLRLYYTTLANASSAFRLDHAAQAPAYDAERIAHLREALDSEELLLLLGSESLEIFLANENPAGNVEFASEPSAQEKKILKDFLLQSNLVPAHTVPVFEYVQGREAAERFFRFAIGWLPPARYEPHHAALLRQAHATAQQAGVLGAILDHLYERALWLTEKVRLETNFFAALPSFASAIVEIAGKIFGGLDSSSILLAGATAEALETAAALDQARPGRLYSLPQNSAYGELFSRALPNITMLSKYDAALESAPDVIVIFENAILPWRDPHFLQKLMQRRNNAPLLLVDLSESPGRREPPAKIYNLYLFLREDLSRLVEQSMNARRETSEEVGRWIAGEVENFHRWLHSEERFHFGAMVGKSRAMQHVFEWIARIARTDITVLIQGESGTGKELVAKAVHEASGRAKLPFVVVNCGAIPENLLESELFGHVRGAFTGATHNKKGLFEEANGGTIFLDEIGELPLALQVKLLRFLQENEIKRVGGNQTFKLEVRVLAASNRDLKEMVAQGKFRSDLYYRLNVVQIDLPPLRQRPEDVVLLAQFFLRKFAARMRRPATALSSEVLRQLQSYHWPGNVRELENVMERAVALSLESEIGLAELPENIRAIPAPDTVLVPPSLKEMERRYIIDTLENCSGNYDEAARVLGIGRTTLWRKLKEYQMQN